MLWFALLLTLLPLRAEFLSVDISVSGLDCASCAASVEKVIGRIRGVESVTFRLQPGVAEIRLKPGNRVQLDAIRDALKGIGYTPGESKVKAEGEFSGEGSSRRFVPGSLDAVYQVEGSEKSVFPGGPVSVEGTIPAHTGRSKPETIRIETIHSQR
jgi:copper chaperone CopZ